MTRCKHPEVIAANTVKNALAWEAAGMTHEACLEAMDIDSNYPKASKLVDWLEDEFMETLENYRRKGTMPPVKVTGKTACKRCNGTGILTMYRHIDGGVCYGCGGSGKSIKYH